MFNLVTLPDPSNPINIIIEPYADVFVNNTSDPLDWTEKIDAAEMKLTPLIDLKRQTIFKFAEDEDDYPFNNMSKITKMVDPSSHRKDWVHTQDYWFMMYIMDKIDFDTFYSAIVHLTFDNIDTKNNHLVDNLLNPDWKIKREQAKSLNNNT